LTGITGKQMQSNIYTCCKADDISCEMFRWCTVGDLWYILFSW